jgi:hypothetical protein
MAKLTRLTFDSRALVSDLRIIDPARFKPEPLAPGAVASPAQIPVDTLNTLVRSAVLGASGLDSADPASKERTVLWRSGASELLLMPNRVVTRLGDGVIALSFAVRCDQSGDAQIHVSFAIGAEARPAGMIAATEERPRGPAAVVDVWGERLIAFAWRVLIELATQIAAESGRDEDGAPLLPVSWAANSRLFIVVPMARHELDRVAG